MKAMLSLKSLGEDHSLHPSSFWGLPAILGYQTDSISLCLGVTWLSSLPASSQDHLLTLCVIVSKLSSFYKDSSH